MLLSCRFLKDVAGVNSFEYANQAEMSEGDTQTVYFQLIDASLDRSQEGFVPQGRRYMPATGATLSVVLGNIDDAKKLTRAATQPFASDPSIWSISVAAADGLRGTVSIMMTLTEPGPKVLKARIPSALVVYSMALV